MHKHVYVGVLWVRALCPPLQVMPTLAQLRVCFPTLDLVLAFVVLPRDVLVCVHSFPYPVGVRGSVFRRGSSVRRACLACLLVRGDCEPSRRLRHLNLLMDALYI